MCVWVEIMSDPLLHKAFEITYFYICQNIKDIFDHMLMYVIIEF